MGDLEKVMFIIIFGAATAIIALVMYIVWLREDNAQLAHRLECEKAEKEYWRQLAWRGGARPSYGSVE